MPPDNEFQRDARVSDGDDVNDSTEAVEIGPISRVQGKLGCETRSGDQ